MSELVCSCAWKIVQLPYTSNSSMEEYEQASVYMCMENSPITLH